jgi:hypothetical protein
MSGKECMLLTRQTILAGIVIGLIALILIGAGVTVVFSSGGTGSAPEETIQDELKALAADTAARIDGDAFAALQPGDENTTEFIAIRDQLNAVRAANPEILYIYTMREAGNATEYVVDADYGISDGVAIGYVYYPTDADTAFLTGFVEPSAEPAYYIGEWGDVIYIAISGYAPIKDSSGAIVGQVGIDIGHVVTQDNLKALAADISAQIDGDAMAALQPGDEGTPEFIAIRDQLDAFRTANPGVVYVYTMRKVGDTVEFVVDADYGIDDGAAIGEAYTNAGPEMLAGFVEPSAESELSTEEWDNVTATIISGYAPIKDSKGTVVGLVGIDFGEITESDQ